MAFPLHVTNNAENAQASTLGRAEVARHYYAYASNESLKNGVSINLFSNTAEIKVTVTLFI